MPTTIKQLLEKNKTAYQKHFYIESVQLSHVLTLRALKEILKEEGISIPSTIKLNECLKLAKKLYLTKPLFKRKLKRSAYKNIVNFNAEHKSLNKSLKFQYPEAKLKNAAKLGIHNMVVLNTALIKLKSNTL